jgi:hypothetical protein
LHAIANAIIASKALQPTHFVQDIRATLLEVASCAGIRERMTASPGNDLYVMCVGNGRRSTWHHRPWRAPAPAGRTSPVRAICRQPANAGIDPNVLVYQQGQ